MGNGVAAWPVGADMSTLHRPFYYCNCLARFIHYVVFKNIMHHVTLVI
uniref:Uncharacterized protein n=1 Tax=Setaria italica TaxID=4555 RepID=K4A3H5_SETIT